MKYELKENEMIRDLKIIDSKKTTIFIILSIFTMVISLIIATNIIGYLVGTRGTFLLNYMEKYDLDQLVFLSSTPIVAMALLFVARKGFKRSYKSLGLVDEKILSNYIKGVLISLLMVSLIVFLLKVFNRVDVIRSPRKIGAFPMTLFIIFWIFQGFEEELLTRGMIFPYFAKEKGVLYGVLANSLIFSILHLGNSSFSILAFVNIFLIGVIFSLLTYLTGSIYLSSAMHSMWNLSQANIYGLTVSGIASSKTSIFDSTFLKPDIINGGGFGIEASILVSILFLILIFLLIKILNKKSLIIKKASLS